MKKRTKAKTVTKKTKVTASKSSKTVTKEKERAFRFFDNREKYLMFVTTCSEKTAVAERIGQELKHVKPGEQALRVFDAGMGDGSVLSYVMRHMHREFTHIPWVVVGKEVSMEDARMSLEKLSDRLSEHPETVFALTNMYYSEAPRLRPNSLAAASSLNWHQVALDGDTSHQFAQQIAGLHDILASDWQVKSSPKTGNPMYERPSVLIVYRKDREFLLKPLIPKPGEIEGKYDLVIASQPYRARTDVKIKVKNVIAPLARAIAPGGRMVTVQSYGNDPGLEIINNIWPDEKPFKTSRDALLKEAKAQLNESDDRDLVFRNIADKQSLFKYHLHTMPSEVGSNIGTSTILAAWNAAVYVAQIEDSRLADIMTHGDYLKAARDVVQKHSGLWFNDESFVISRKL